MTSRLHRQPKTPAHSRSRSPDARRLESNTTAQVANVPRERVGRATRHDTARARPPQIYRPAHSGHPRDAANGRSRAPRPQHFRTRSTYHRTLHTLTRLPVKKIQTFVMRFRAAA